MPRMIPWPRTRPPRSRRSDRIRARHAVHTQALAAQPALPDHPAQLAAAARARGAARHPAAGLERGIAARLR